VALSAFCFDRIQTTRSVQKRRHGSVRAVRIDVSLGALTPTAAQANWAASLDSDYSVPTVRTRRFISIHCDCCILLSVLCDLYNTTAMLGVYCALCAILPDCLEGERGSCLIGVTRLVG